MRRTLAHARIDPSFKIASAPLLGRFSDPTEIMLKVDRLSVTAMTYLAITVCSFHVRLKHSDDGGQINAKTLTVLGIDIYQEHFIPSALQLDGHVGKRE